MSWQVSWQVEEVYILTVTESKYACGLADKKLMPTCGYKQTE